MFEYYVNTVQIMDMMRDTILQLRATMKNIIRLELYAVDREYILGFTVLSILVIISPMMIYMVRNAVTALQVGEKMLMNCFHLSLGWRHSRRKCLLREIFSCKMI